jgi:hypothetical protein
VAFELETPSPIDVRGTSADEPVVVFDRVSLAFDEKIILDEVTFSLLPGRMKIIPGRVARARRRSCG